jgi:hypothetical protein
LIQGVCKFCLEEKMLCDSHLAPAGLYKYCKAKEIGPVLMTREEVSVANEEVTEYLLCEECENLLNREGENWLLPKLATIDQKFPFYDLLVTGTPDTMEDGIAAYTCPRNEKIGFRKLTNFVIGVFWKASFTRGAREGPDRSLSSENIGRARAKTSIGLSLYECPIPDRQLLFGSLVS